MTGGIPTYKTKYNTLADVPDELVRQYSPRDPNNKFYESRRWYDMKKRQIFFSQRDGIPIYLRTPGFRAFYYGTWAINIFTASYAMYTFIQYSSGKLTKK